VPAWRRVLVGPALLAGLALLGGAPTLAAFSSSSSSSGNSLASAPDWVAPSASSTVIAKTPGYIAGYVKQGGSYYIYANVADTGNPPSGINVATGDVSAITTAGVAVPLLPGAFSVEGTAYNYRSAATTVKNPLAAASYGYSLTSTDLASNSGLQTGFSVTVDNTVPSASTLQAANGGSIVGRPELGDTITYTFSEPIDPQSILAGWTGAATNIVVRINNTATDTVLIYNSSNTTQLPMGSVNLARTDYVNANRTFGASGTPSSMVRSGSTITVTLGTQSGAGTTAAATGTMTWTPQTTPYDRAGNAMSATAANETGAADKEF
jgi:predicted ribosomally synthesized peptide with SipW-like signal peptide